MGNEREQITKNPITIITPEEFAQQGAGASWFTQEKTLECVYIAKQFEAEINAMLDKDNLPHTAENKLESLKSMIAGLSAYCASLQRVEQMFRARNAELEARIAELEAQG
jgi:DNA-binding transcriptional MerR regulator